MDEVENPALPAADESSPTIPPVADDTQVVVPLVTAVEEEEAILPPGPEDPDVPPPKPPRPPLKRDSSSGSALPPQQLPPAPPAATTEELSQDAPDSLTLADLKRIRGVYPYGNTPLVEKEQLLDYRRVYDFEYQDAQVFPVELEEWFSYSEEEDMKLRRCKVAFNEQWRASEDGKQDWLDVSEDARRTYVKAQIKQLRNGEEEAVIAALQNLTYIGLGVWEETAGRQEGHPLADLFHKSSGAGAKLEDYASSNLQIQWIVTMVDILRSCDGIKAIYETLRKICEDDFQSAPAEFPGRNDSQPRRADESMELWCCLTLMYLFVEVARTTEGPNGQTLKNDILALEPNFLNYLTQIVARLRWDESAPIPLTKMLLLAWKTILVSFGGIKDIEHIKSTLREDEDEMDARGKPIITASPLDYHLFRQEINSKYPAYQPPEPLFPLEPENNSILPPLKHRRPSAAMSDTSFASAPTAGNGSIMHQPVHIATPAPSPPPSPGGPGKAGKKQNYQTNQMFPFLYPPLDENSNELGGKGSTELQDALVGRRWEGTDIPTSILEAAELFAKRMRATRGMKQLWETRVDYMKYERGWKGGADLDNNDVDDFELVPEPAKEETAEQGEPLPQTEEQRKLNAVNDFYRDSLPHLQSVVIVLLKAVLQNVTDLVTKGNGQNGLQAGFQFNEPNGLNGSVKPAENGNGHMEHGENTSEELDKLRSQEIAAKALSAVLLLLLKWFKLNHILQYEYMTQLLLDSNYVPLILKLWQTHEIGRACHYPLEREEANFFYFCQSTSRQGPPKRRESSPIPPVTEDDSDEDDAAPPPIKMSRSDPEPEPTSFPPEPEYTHPPEIDELGYPQTPLPSNPITSYSWRNTFTAINYLRVLQKITRRKTHRSLLLVSYKSSIHLKKTLKIPVHPLRYYTLKLFKSQVPFCGRKWRQGNMKIITAVWLSVPAELRDDWLSGGGGGMGGACIGDVDGTVEDALPLEQSLRALTHWWNVRNFREVMGGEGAMKELEEEEGGFFERELEKLDVARVAMGEEDGEGHEGEWHGPVEGY